MLPHNLKDILVIDFAHCPCCAKRWRESPAYQCKKFVSTRAKEILLEWASLTGEKPEFLKDIVGFAVHICVDCVAYRRDLSGVVSAVRYMLLSGEFEPDWIRADEFVELKGI